MQYCLFLLIGQLTAYDATPDPEGSEPERRKSEGASWTRHVELPQEGRSALEFA